VGKQAPTAIARRRSVQPTGMINLCPLTSFGMGRTTNHRTPAPHRRRRPRSEPAQNPGGLHPSIGEKDRNVLESPLGHRAGLRPGIGRRIGYPRTISALAALDLPAGDQPSLALADRQAKARRKAPGFLSRIRRIPYIMPPMPPMSPPPGMAKGAASFSSATMASVVMSNPAMEAAFCKVERVTLAGSMIPAFIRSS